jgi:hypothetical protein
MKSFKDLQFKKRFDKETTKLMPLFNDCENATLDFDNGYSISVVTGYGTHTSVSEPYECAVLFNGELTYSTHITDDVIGYCNEEDVTKIMKQIQEL